MLKPEDTADDLAGRTIGVYRIVSRLGAGGMGEVYAAHDTKLDRPVAVKLLHPLFARDPDRLRRFRTEIRAVSSLNHPHIVVVHDVGEIDGRPFVVTELVEGETLRERIAEGPLAADRALAVALQMTHAIAAAHARGILHRDLKPENVMVRRDGYVKVLDFGLAKLEPAAALTGVLGDVTRMDTLPGTTQSISAEQQTQLGNILGTIGYMSPEQMRGGAVDHRTDIFSLGAVLYELLSGRRAFGGGSASDAVIAVQWEQPADLAHHPGIPPGLARVVHRCLEKDPAQRFQSAADLASALESLTGDDPHAAGGRDRSIAVLPFASLMPSPEDRLFCDGLTEEIIAELAGIRALRVISRTSVMQFRDTCKDLRTIGRQLGVRYILEGSVRKASGHLRITAQLIDADADTHLWAEKYNGTVDDVFDVQERVAREIVRALDITLTADEERRLAARTIANPRAFELYLHAREEIRRMADGPERALALLATAVEIEGETPALSALIGWAKVAQVKAGTNRDLTLLDEADAHARTVLAIAPHTADGHAVKGYAAFERGRLQEAVSSFGRALRYEPNDPDVLLYLGLAYIYGGENDRALEVSRRVTACDPLGALSWMLAGVVQWFRGRFDAASAPIQHALELDPHNYMAHWTLGYAYALQRRLPDMERQAIWLEAVAPEVPYTRHLRGLFEGLAGRPERALKRLEPINLAAMDQHLEFHVAEAFAVAGCREQALALAHRAVQDGFYPYPFLARYCPFVAGLRDLTPFVATLAAAKEKADAFHEWARDAPGIGDSRSV